MDSLLDELFRRPSVQGLPASNASSSSDDIIEMCVCQRCPSTTLPYSLGACYVAPQQPRRARGIDPRGSRRGCTHARAGVPRLVPWKKKS